MTTVISDTDILSTFGKIARIELLLLLFQKVHVAPAVYRELLQAERMGFVWVASLREAVELLPLSVSESQQAERLARRYPQLGSGEIESFVLAQTHQLLCLTNDRQAKLVARALSLPYLDLEEVLRALKTRRLLTTEALSQVITEIEERDYTRITAKDQILGS
jgi:predicted nucleic acid-binding protein